MMRRTGKTFRALTNALNSASNDEHVVVECSSMDMANWTFRKACEIASVFMEVDSPKPRLLKIGNGSVTFISKLNRDRVKRADIRKYYYDLV